MSTRAASTGWSEWPRARSAAKRCVESAQGVGPLRHRRRPHVVDDLVGVPAEPVQRRARGAAWPEAAAGPPSSTCAVPPVQCPTGRRSLPRSGVAVDRRRRPDPLGGQPPGEEHHRDAHAGHGARPDEHQARGPARRRCRDGTGRSGRTGGPARTASPFHAGALPVGRVDERAPPRRRRDSRARPPAGQAVADRSRSPGSSRRRRRGWAPARARRASGVRAAPGRLGDGGHRDQDRRVGHRPALAEQGTEGAVPLTARNGCCGGRSRPAAAPPTPACHTTADGE